jgi:hypothetical protein
MTAENQIIPEQTFLKGGHTNGHHPCEQKHLEKPKLKP